VLMGTAAAATAVHPAVAEAAAAPAVTFDFSTAPSGLQWADLKLGTGAAPQAGSALVIDYIMTRRAGEQIHSTVKAQEPFSWVLGAGTVIEGLEQAVAGGGGVPPMLPGGARRVIVPMALGYGKSADDQGLMWQTAVRENLGPIPPENFEWVDRRGDKVNSFFRFKSLYLNPNRFDQPDLVLDIKLRDVGSTSASTSSSTSEAAVPVDAMAAPTPVEAAPSAAPSPATEPSEPTLT